MSKTKFRCYVSGTVFLDVPRQEEVNNNSNVHDIDAAATFTNLNAKSEPVGIRKRGRPRKKETQRAKNGKVMVACIRLDVHAFRFRTAYWQAVGVYQESFNGQKNLPEPN